MHALIETIHFFAIRAHWRYNALHSAIIASEKYNLDSLQEQVSRLPYLCEGEFDCPMFTLDDAVLTLSVRDHTVPFSEQSAQPTTSGDEADDEPPPLSETSETWVVLLVQRSILCTSSHMCDQNDNWLKCGGCASLQLKEDIVILARPSLLEHIRVVRTKTFPSMARVL